MIGNIIISSFPENLISIRVDRYVGAYPLREFPTSVERRLSLSGQGQQGAEGADALAFLLDGKHGDGALADELFGDGAQ